ncbi:MAG TPA: hypothetical protein VM101_08540, partial [Flavitalea sp.]|nr:hypothetical protein [Flavitalea sp.]
MKKVYGMNLIEVNDSNLNGNSNLKGMEVDSTTYNDLSVFHREEEFSIFHKLNFTKTEEGKEWLFRFFKSPFSDAKLIIETQNIIRQILEKENEWPSGISNGTVMVITRFYESSIDTIPSSSNYMEALSYKVFHAPDFSLLRYSLTHFADFIRGMRTLIGIFDNDSTPPVLRRFILRAKDLIGKSMAAELGMAESSIKFSYTDTVKYGKFIRYEYKNNIYELISIFGRLDAWYSMAIAMKMYKLTLPVVNEHAHPYINAKGLYHVLLPSPVPYDIDMNIDSNFIFLTGANMAGKSTFIKAVGSAVFLAHLGMGVPATEMNLTVFDGLLSNINVVDNIIKGESYFFNEVQ